MEDWKEIHDYNLRDAGLYGDGSLGPFPKEPKNRVPKPAPKPAPKPKPSVPTVDFIKAKAPPLPEFNPMSSGLMQCCGLGGLSGWHASTRSRLGRSNMSGYSNYLAVLNGSQRKIWHDQLIAAGFKVLRNGLFNDQHSSLLTLYLWEKYPNKSPDNPEFDKKFNITEASNGYRYCGISTTGTKDIPLEEFLAETQKA